MGDDEQDAIDLPRSLLPDAKDGDILNIKIAIKSRKTDEAKKEVADMISKLAARKNL